MVALCASAITWHRGSGWRKSFARPGVGGGVGVGRWGRSLQDH